MEGSNPQVQCKLGTIVPAVRLCEQTEIAVLVRGEMCVERLQKLPHEWCSGDCRVRVLGTIAKAGTNGLVHVEHVGVIVPTMTVQHGI